MSKRARMGELAQVLLEPSERAEQPQTHQEPKEQKTSNPKSGKQVFGKLASRRITPPAELRPVDVHREYGDRGDFEKVTVTLPSDVRGLLLEESLRRKKEKSDNWPIAAIVREAIASYLSPKQ